MNIFKHVWLWIIGSFVTILGFFNLIVFRRMRLRQDHAIALFDLVLKEGKSLIMNEEYVGETVLPKTFSSYCILHGIPMYFNIEERILRAGQASTDSICNIKFFRPHAGKLKKIIQGFKIVKDDIPVSLLRSWSSERIGILKQGETIRPYLDTNLYEDLEKEVVDVITGKINKTGAILHGQPGNGKSFLIRYFCLKYKLPIHIASFNPDMTNPELIRMFSHVEGPAIVVLEDFDNYFNKRRCLLPDCKFTFDTLLNVFDGLFATHKQVIFFMTANDIGKVDNALMDRPSRFKFVVEIPTPSESIRNRIFSSFNGSEKDAIAMTSGMSLDNILTIRDKIVKGKSLKEAIHKVPTKAEG